MGTQRAGRAPGPEATEFLFRAALIVGIYYCGGRLGLLLAFAHSNVTPFWPPSGIAVASLLLCGLRYWPALALGAFVLNLTTGLPATVAGGLAAGNTLEYVLAAVALGRLGFERSMRKPLDILLLTAFGGLLCPLVAATIGTFSLLAGGIVARGDAARVWQLYLVGDGVGVLAFTPFIFAWAAAFRTPPDVRRIGEAVAIAAVTVVFASIVFLGGLPFAYFIFPLAIVASIRFGQRGGTASALCVSLIAVYGEAHNLGPFHQPTVIARVENLQVYLAAFILTALVLAATSTAQKEAERTVLEHAAQLEASNRELEAFAYTIAHDLRAPLRAINGFSQAVIEDYADRLPEDANHSLQRIATNAVAMGVLIDALLDFARLGSKRIERTLLRPATVAQQAYERLRQGEPDRQVDITIGETPMCLADPALLGLVYQNLIDNALKFAGKRETVTIDVGWVPACEDCDVPVYYVRDNGIGFDMKYLDKIFGVFARLHRESDYPGTGAGLAIVKRIVDRHGGAVWAHAEPGRGATFFFTLRGAAR